MKTLGKIALVALSITLAGCVTPTLSAGSGSSAGTFMKVNGAVADALAEDSVSILAQLLAPATTYVVFHQGEESELGQSIEKRMRNRGYSVDVSFRTEEELPRESVVVRYVADEMGGLVRLTVVVYGIDKRDYTVLSRGYVVRRAEVIPAGSWARQG